MRESNVFSNVTPERFRGVSDLDVNHFSVNVEEDNELLTNLLFFDEFDSMTDVQGMVFGSVIGFSIVCLLLHN